MFIFCDLSDNDVQSLVEASQEEVALFNDIEEQGKDGGQGRGEENEEYEDKGEVEGQIKRRRT
eukprot:6053530-Prorocentrum_lima.AAC.1